MRLLNTTSIEIEQFGDDAIPPYAILSHTWLEEEIIFQDLGQAHAASKKGYKKMTDFCSVARANGFQYGWMDTCCIDKTSSAELSEAINSMYHWYQEAAVCYTFLPDVSSLSELSGSRWFTRGWTLQELIAPSHMTFFDKDWSELGTKASLGQTISDCTGVPLGILSGKEHFETASIAQRMSWAADRNTTKTEDRAYCLMGIFGINMPLLYGEGARAFIRLQEEIMRVSDDQSLFAWRHPSSGGGLLAITPEAFKASGNIIPWNPLTPYNSPITVTNKGVHLELPFIGLGQHGTGLAILHCTEIGNEDHLLSIYLRDSFLTMEHFERCRTDSLKLISLRKFSPSQYPTRNLCIKLRGPSVQAMRNQDTNLTGKALQKLETRNIREQQATLKAEIGDVDINSRDADGCSPLLCSAAKGHEGVVWLLLTRSDGRTILSHAARGGHEAQLSQLLTRKDTQAYLIDGAGRSVLSHAAENGHESVVKMILGSGKVEADMKDQKGRSALWLLLETGWVDAESKDHNDVVKLLLDHQASVEHRANGDRTALCEAAANGHATIVEHLLNRNANVATSDKAGRAPLWYAAEGGHESIAKMLLEKGAAAETRGTNGNRSNTIARMLLEKGACIIDPSSNRLVGLEVAAAHGHVAVVETDTAATTIGLALSQAIVSGHEATAMLLMGAIRGDMKVWKGRDVLRHAIQTIKGCGAIADTLLEVPHGGWKSHVVTDFLLNGEKPEGYPTGREGPSWGLAKADYYNVDALWCAAVEGNTACVEVLLRHGVSTPIRAPQLNNALKFAQKQGHSGIVRLLRRHLAR
ncbi:putative ankyrin repeat-containing protein [Thelonectria olida]|uniref:Ankyrin repeat-containing protein n=1 Tax=Thelonectria olida TaxID=1576542 RepID=A0A9P8VTA9_9HYPO|nr:putative ankyrin repeat-containing protein [Thelonectria olida]